MKTKNKLEIEHRPILSLFKRKKKSPQPKEDPEQKESQDLQPLSFKDFYSVIPPFGNVGIQTEKSTGRLLYLVIEPTMDENEQKAFNILKSMLREEAKVPLSVLKDEALVNDFLRKDIPDMIKRFRLKVTKESLEKFIYYVKRDFVGYGIIDVLIRDPNIEDISCNGGGIPIYVWHRLYESLPTNVAFANNVELDTFITRLAV